MIGVNAWWVYLAPQNIPRAIRVLTLGNKVILYCIVDSLDQVSNWCDNNHMVINPIKTKSMTSATRQKHQLSIAQFLQAKTMDCVRILLVRQTDRQRVFRVIAIAVTGHLRPILYTHRTPPSPSDCLWGWPFLLFLFSPLLYCSL